MLVSAPIKYSEHILTSYKLVDCHGRTLMTSSSDLKKNTKYHLLKVVRITLTDEDATDSDEEDDVWRVKKHVLQINLKSTSPSPSKLVTPSKEHHRRHGTKRCTIKLSESVPKKFKSVLQRPWGRWAAKIRDPSLHKRVRYETFETSEEAARAYDAALLCNQGDDAVTKFPHTVSADFMVFDGVSSPTSVLRHGELTPFNCWIYGDVDAFGFEIDDPPLLSTPEISKKYFAGGEEFGDVDLNDFMVDVMW